VFPSASPIRNRLDSCGLRRILRAPAIGKRFVQRCKALPGGGVLGVRQIPLFLFMHSIVVSLGLQAHKPAGRLFDDLAFVLRRSGA